ncbi:hypothetical protein [uncultured Brevibacillus sp.]|uniref:hypothetical protein n=1 Tax=uncultured Brevibacillus sp. TaxID=169970 RepID=UPI002592C4FE|nr:hypothetical protein [uncultured Brevibacillus sp.]
METLQQYIPKWREVFKAATIAKRKMLLRPIIGGIRGYRDRVEVTFKLRISQFIDAMGCVESKGVKTPDEALYGKVLVHGVSTFWRLVC